MCRRWRRYKRRPGSPRSAATRRRPDNRGAHGWATGTSPRANEAGPDSLHSGRSCAPGCGSSRRRPARGVRAAFAPLGLLEAESPYSAPTHRCPGPRRGGGGDRRTIEAATRPGHTKPVNGWSRRAQLRLQPRLLRLGTIDTPQWKFADLGHAHLRRAVAARAGCGATTATRPPTRVPTSTTGASISTATGYMLHFDHMPPVDAFWSVTMYDLPRTTW